MFDSVVTKNVLDTRAKVYHENRWIYDILIDAKLSQKMLEVFLDGADHLDVACSMSKGDFPILKMHRFYVRMLKICTINLILDHLPRAKQNRYQNIFKNKVNFKSYRDELMAFSNQDLEDMIIRDMQTDMSGQSLVLVGDVAKQAVIENDIPYFKTDFSGQIQFIEWMSSYLNNYLPDDKFKRTLEDYNNRWKHFLFSSPFKTLLERLIALYYPINSPERHSLPLIWNTLDNFYNNPPILGCVALFQDKRLKPISFNILFQTADKRRPSSQLLKDKISWREIAWLRRDLNYYHLNEKTFTLPISPNDFKALGRDFNDITCQDILDILTYLHLDEIQVDENQPTLSQQDLNPHLSAPISDLIEEKAFFVMMNQIQDKMKHVKLADFWEEKLKMMAERCVELVNDINMAIKILNLPTDATHELFLNNWQIVEAGFDKTQRDAIFYRASGSNDSEYFSDSLTEEDVAFLVEKLSEDDLLAFFNGIKQSLWNSHDSTATNILNFYILASLPSTEFNKARSILRSYHEPMLDTIANRFKNSSERFQDQIDDSLIFQKKFLAYHFLLKNHTFPKQSEQLKREKNAAALILKAWSIIAQNLKKEYIESDDFKVITWETLTTGLLERIYRKASLNCHPDRFPNVTAERKEEIQTSFQKLTAAKILIDYYKTQPDIRVNLQDWQTVRSTDELLLPNDWTEDMIKQTAERYVERCWLSFIIFQYFPKLLCLVRLVRYNKLGAAVEVLKALDPAQNNTDVADRNRHIDNFKKHFNLPSEPRNEKTSRFYGGVFSQVPTEDEDAPDNLPPKSNHGVER